MKKLLSLTQLFEYTKNLEINSDIRELIPKTFINESVDTEKSLALDVLNLSCLIVERMELRDNIAKLEYDITSNRVYALLEKGEYVELDYLNLINFDSIEELNLIFSIEEKFYFWDGSKTHFIKMFNKMSWIHFGSKKVKKPKNGYPQYFEPVSEEQEQIWWNNYKELLKKTWGDNIPVGVHTEHHEKLSDKNKIAENLFNLGTKVVKEKCLIDVSYLTALLIEGSFHLFSVDVNGNKKDLDYQLLHEENDKERMLEIEVILPKKNNDIEEIITTLEAESKKYFSNNETFFEIVNTSNVEPDVNALFSFILKPKK